MDEVNYKNNFERTLDYLYKFDREKVLKSLIDTDTPTILDVGSNVGQTLKEFKKWWPKSYVHCFEPLPEFYDELIKFDYDRVYYWNYGLGNENKTDKFYYHKIQPMLSGFEKLNTESKDSVAINEPKLAGMKDGEFLDNINDEVSVEVQRLDDIWDGSKVHILKMDTQGWETEILKGAQETLERTEVVLTELNFYDLYESRKSFSSIEKYLLPKGFRLYDISHISKNPMNGRTDWVDVIYKKEK